MDVSAFLKIRPAPAAVLHRANLHPDAVRFFVRNADTSWQPVTWRAFADQLVAVASRLRAMGIGPGEHCAVYGANSVSWAAAALAIQAAGATLVPIYPASTAAQVAYVATHAEVKALFVGGGVLRDRLSGVPRDVAVLSLDATRGMHGERLIAGWHDLTELAAGDLRAAYTDVAQWIEALDLDAPGVMLYTSGTSGQPKGVPLSHRNVGTNAADWLRNHQSVIEEGDRDVLWLPLSHIFGFGELCLGNTLGWQSYLVAPADALAVLPEVKPHVFMSVPAYWEKLARATAERAGGAAPEFAAAASAPASEPTRAALAAWQAAFAAVSGGALRFGLSGGAGLKVAIKEQLRAAGLVVIEGYGLTETAPTLTLNHPQAYRFDTVGKPLPSVQLQLAPDGEILAKGPNVFRGYYKDPVATAAAFTADGWFCTGDIGAWTEDGFLRIVDRKKDILVTAGGKNVPPANIEAHFAGDALIDKVVVYGDGRSYLTAGVWLVPEAVAAAQAAGGFDAHREVSLRIAAVNARLAQFETIKKFWIATAPLTVEAGLLTSSLKLRRKAVYEHFASQFEALYL